MLGFRAWATGIGARVWRLQRYCCYFLISSGLTCLEGYAQAELGHLGPYRSCLEKSNVASVPGWGFIVLGGLALRVDSLV